MKLLLLIPMIALVAGCTTTGNVNKLDLDSIMEQDFPHAIQDDTNLTVYNASKKYIVNATQDPCEGITCKDTLLECEDKAVARCLNTCIKGECTQCEPDCNGHNLPPDPCEAVSCHSNFVICPDSFNATCENTCSDGKCSDCLPDCTGHVCEESWACTQWGPCMNMTQARVCTDKNSCGTSLFKPEESMACETNTTEPPTNTSLNQTPEGNLAGNTTNQTDNNITIPENNQENRTFMINITSIHEKNPEWVEIWNLGDFPAWMGNWTLTDSTNKSSNTYTFPEFVLTSRSMVRVYTGPGTDNESELYWGKKTSIWNDDGDIATLMDSNKTIIYVYSY